MIFSPLHIMPASIFIMVLDQFLFFSFMNLFFMLFYWIVLIGRFRLVLKWDNLYFHPSQDLLANNIVSSVNLFELLWCKLLISSIIFQVLSINCTICFTLLAHSLFHYIFIYLCIEPSDKVEGLVMKVANQGFQLVVFSNTFVGGYPREMPLETNQLRVIKTIAKSSKHTQNM